MFQNQARALLHSVVACERCSFWWVPLTILGGRFAKMQGMPTTKLSYSACGLKSCRREHASRDAVPWLNAADIRHERDMKSSHAQLVRCKFRPRSVTPNMA